MESGRGGWHIGVESVHQICSHAISQTVSRLMTVIYTKSVTARRLSRPARVQPASWAASFPVIFLTV